MATALQSVAGLCPGVHTPLAGPDVDSFHRKYSLKFEPIVRKEKHDWQRT